MIPDKTPEEQIDELVKRGIDRETAKAMLALGTPDVIFEDEKGNQTPFFDRVADDRSK